MWRVALPLRRPGFLGPVCSRCVPSLVYGLVLSTSALSGSVGSRVSLAGLGAFCLVSGSLSVIFVPVSFLARCVCASRVCAFCLRLCVWSRSLSRVPSYGTVDTMQESGHGLKLNWR